MALYCAHIKLQLTCIPALHAGLGAVLSWRQRARPLWGHALIIALLYNCPCPCNAQNLSGIHRLIRLTTCQLLRDCTLPDAMPRHGFLRVHRGPPSVLDGMLSWVLRWRLWVQTP